MNDFGKNLAAYRKQAGMSAQALSDALGGTPTRSVIANWEGGRKSDITVAELVRISAAIGVAPADLCPELDFGRAERLRSAKRVLREAMERITTELEQEA